MPIGTAYSPQRDGDRMEGGYASAYRDLWGDFVVHTVADYLAGRSSFVTVAMDPNLKGTMGVIPEITVNVAGQTVTLKDLPVVANDTGSAFKNTNGSKIDIAIDKDLPSGQLDTQPFSMKEIDFKPLSNYDFHELTQPAPTSVNWGAAQAAPQPDQMALHNPVGVAMPVVGELNFGPAFGSQAAVNAFSGPPSTIAGNAGGAYTPPPGTVSGPSILSPDGPPLGNASLPGTTFGDMVPPSFRDSVVTSGFGNRASPTAGATTNHAGVDYRAPIGTELNIAKGGIVEFAGVKGGYGNLVEINHGIDAQGNKISSRYGHLDSISPGIQVGSIVEAGQIVGTTGNTGISTGPHLHHEVRVDGVPVDPRLNQGVLDSTVLTADGKLATPTPRPGPDQLPAPTQIAQPPGVPFGTFDQPVIQPSAVPATALAAPGAPPPASAPSAPPSVNIGGAPPSPTVAGGGTIPSLPPMPGSVRPEIGGPVPLNIPSLESLPPLPAPPPVDPVAPTGVKTSTISVQNAPVAAPVGGVGTFGTPFGGTPAADPLAVLAGLPSDAQLAERLPPNPNMGPHLPSTPTFAGPSPVPAAGTPLSGTLSTPTFAGPSPVPAAGTPFGGAPSTPTYGPQTPIAPNEEAMQLPVDGPMPATPLTLNELPPATAPQAAPQAPSSQGWTASPIPAFDQPSAPPVAAPAPAPAPATHPDAILGGMQSPISNGQPSVPGASVAADIQNGLGQISIPDSLAGPAPLTADPRPDIAAPTSDLKGASAALAGGPIVEQLSGPPMELTAPTMPAFEQKPLDIAAPSLTSPASFKTLAEIPTVEDPAAAPGASRGVGGPATPAGQPVPGPAVVAPGSQPVAAPTVAPPAAAQPPTTAVAPSVPALSAPITVPDQIAAPMAALAGIGQQPYSAPVDGVLPANMPSWASQGLAGYGPLGPVTPAGYQYGPDIAAIAATGGLWGGFGGFGGIDPSSFGGFGGFGGGWGGYESFDPAAYSHG